MKKVTGRVYIVNKARTRAFEEVEKAVYHPFSHILEIYRHNPFGVFCHQIVVCEYGDDIKCTGIKIKVGDH